MNWWYLSFATDEGFRGACVVRAQEFGPAVLRATMLGINPGGQVMGLQIEDEERLPAERWRERLLTKEEVREAMGPIVNPRGEPR